MEDIMKDNKLTTATEQEVYAALKLIEALYLDDKLPKHIYDNIHREYAPKALTKPQMRATMDSVPKIGG